MELFKASNQWASRPADERFWTIQEMVDATRALRDKSVQGAVRYGDLRVEADNGDLRLLGKTDVPAKLTNWSFSQLSKHAGAPPGYLRKLPATLAAQNINHGLKGREDDDQARLLLTRTNGPGSFVARAMTSPRYTRVWNNDVGTRLLDLVGQGWVTPPAMHAAADDPRAREATEADCGDHTYITPGTMISPAGIYASDHDMFVFMVNPERQIDDGSDDGLYRGFFVWNSEVGAQAFGIMMFMFQKVCGNHIVWGAEDVKELRIRHIGEADTRVFQELQVKLIEYSDSSVSDIEAQIKRAQTLVLGANKEEVVDELLGFSRRKRLQIPRKTFRAAYDVAESREDDYGDPNTLWGMVSGLTQHSQTLAHTDARVEADRLSGKLMTMAF